MRVKQAVKVLRQYVLLVVFRPKITLCVECRLTICSNISMFGGCKIFFRPLSDIYQRYLETGCPNVRKNLSNKIALSPVGETRVFTASPLACRRPVPKSVQFECAKHIFVAKHYQDLRHCYKCRPQGDEAIETIGQTGRKRCIKHTQKSQNDCCDAFCIQTNNCF